MKNWKTTLFGTLTSICTGVAVLDLPYKEYFAAGAIVFGALFSLFAKDKNVTGGDIQSILGTIRPDDRK
jgi:hypothetical protein